jgi:hypothetical protein
MLLFEYENWHFNSEVFYLTSKKLLDWVWKVFSTSVIHKKSLL